MSYDIGDLVHLTNLFTNEAGIPTDPSSVVVTITQPDGTTGTPSTPANAGTPGSWEAFFSPAQNGVHAVKWVASGGVTVADTKLLLVGDRFPPGSAYASVADVRALLGPLAVAFTTSSQPSEADIAGFLVSTAGQLDALIGAHGFTVPLDPASLAARSLQMVNADGALMLALAARWPEDDGPASAVGALDRATKRWNAAVQALASGKAPAIGILESQTSSDPTATSFWENEPGYGWPSGVPVPERLLGYGIDATDWNPATAPQFAKGQSL